MTTSTEELVRERRGPVLVVRLNRPEARNALTPGLLSGIGAAMLEAESDPDIRVVVLTGTGDRAFCAGMDLRSFSNGEKMSGDADEAAAAYQRLLQGELTVPVIGAANGTAVGGGLELLLGCDLIIASAQAKFGLPEVRRGLFAAGGGVFIGTRIPLGIALEMTLTGDSIDATRAYEIGLVNTVAAPDDVLGTALAFAEGIADNAPLGLAASKELVRLGVSDADRAADRLKEWQSIVFASQDAKEGATAFVEKRKPVWQGR
jgi:enoyl-CoA hydratase/carnithine racemase